MNATELADKYEKQMYIDISLDDKEEFALVLTALRALGQTPDLAKKE